MEPYTHTGNVQCLQFCKNGKRPWPRVILHISPPTHGFKENHAGSCSVRYSFECTRKKNSRNGEIQEAESTTSTALIYRTYAAHTCSECSGADQRFICCGTAIECTAVGHWENTTKKELVKIDCLIGLLMKGSKEQKGRKKRKKRRKGKKETEETDRDEEVEKKQTKKKESNRTQSQCCCRTSMQSHSTPATKRYCYYWPPPRPARGSKTKQMRRRHTRRHSSIPERC